MPSLLVDGPLRVIDSHTAGEPTRVVISGGPDLGSGSTAERLNRFRRDFDEFRSAVVNEPRGSDVMVGALLLPSSSPSADYGVIYFNNVGFLGMCGHGTIGVVSTLAYLGKLEPGRVRLETSVGTVTAELMNDRSVAVRNIESYRTAQAVTVLVPEIGPVTGDIAWGGNWFFLVTSEPPYTLDYQNRFLLTDYCSRVKDALADQGITGRSGAEIDHVELFAPSPNAGSDSRNFVLCPGNAYDRSPCGTGTSAKMACLFADGKLHPGEIYRQESILGTIFEGTIQVEGDAIMPTIVGRAYVTAESVLIFDPNDPLASGVRI